MILDNLFKIKELINKRSSKLNTFANANIDLAWIPILKDASENSLLEINNNVTVINTYVHEIDHLSNGAKISNNVLYGMWERLEKLNELSFSSSDKKLWVFCHSLESISLESQFRLFQTISLEYNKKAIKVLEKIELLKKVNQKESLFLEVEKNNLIKLMN